MGGIVSGKGGCWVYRVCVRGNNEQLHVIYGRLFVSKDLVVLIVGYMGCWVSEVRGLNRDKI